MRTMKKQNEHDDSSLETAVFLIRSSYNGGFDWQPPKTKEPITRAQGLTGYRLCVYASGSLITAVFNSFTRISVSCLHFGQNNGKFSSIVSDRTFVRVLLLQTGHITHSIFHKWDSSQSEYAFDWLVVEKFKVVRSDISSVFLGWNFKFGAPHRARANFVLVIYDD